MTNILENLPQLWETIRKSGGIDAYINQELRRLSYYVERQSTSDMSKKDLSAYKKSLKAEAHQKRILKKEAWEAYKSAHIVHLGEGIFWNDQLDFDKWDLPEAEKRAAENELPSLKNPAELAHALGIEITELRKLTYHRDAATSINYRRFTIPKATGGERNIWAPLPRLKAAQNWILRDILEYIPVHGAAHGFLPGRSIFSNAGVHTNARVVIRVDLKDFFPTITFRRVKGVYRKAGYREQIATLLALLSTEPPRKELIDEGKKYYISLGPRCLPQGAPTSPALTNIICMRLDRRLTGLAQKFGWRYSRYADDLTFSLPENMDGKPGIGRLLGGINEIVKDEGFQVHRKKTKVSRRGGRQAVTGLVVNGPAAPRVPRKLKREIRAAIHNSEKGKSFKPGDDYHRIKGYAAYIYMTDPILGAKLLQQLKALAPENDTK